MINPQVAEYLRFFKEIGVEHLYDIAPVEADSLDGIAAEIGGCKGCGLHSSRKNPVMGEGHPGAGLMFIGEAPGYEEDVQGRPFVGAAGKLLTDIIRAMRFDRKDVYIANVLKCRPPDNRNPREEEIAACLPYLFRMIACIRPEAICTLGTFAAQALLDTTLPVSRLRGKFHDFRGIKVMPTYHPAYLLRNPAAKRMVWEDMQKVMSLFGKKPEAPRKKQP
jgi:DNA polymerase